MKANFILNVALCMAFTVVVKSSPLLNRQKRVDASSPGTSKRLRSPFQPPDENGNTFNYEENHLSESNRNAGAPLRSPYLPPAEPELQKPKLVLNRSPRTTTKKPKVPNKRVQKARRNNFQKPETLLQNAHPSTGNEDKKAPSTSVIDNRKSPFQPPRNEEVFRDADAAETSIPARTAAEIQRKPIYRQAVKKSVRRPSSDLEIIMERQRENTREIPSISDIKVSPRQHKRRQQPNQQPQTPKSSPAIRVKAIRSKPKHTSYQNRVHAQRDMHDVGPGVTPWTRYTVKPRNGGRRKNAQSSSYRGRCGSKQYSPRSQICCQGNVLRRQGIQPSCCGSKTYDAVYKKCCRGEVVMQTVQRPGC